MYALKYTIIFISIENQKENNETYSTQGITGHPVVKRTREKNINRPTRGCRMDLAAAVTDLGKRK